MLEKNEINLRVLPGNREERFLEQLVDVQIVRFGPEPSQGGVRMIHLVFEGGVPGGFGTKPLTYLMPEKI